MLKPIFAVCLVFASIVALPQRPAQACNASEDRIAPPIAIKLDPKGFKTTPTQVKIGQQLYKLNAEIIQNRMPSIGSPSQTPSYANVSLVPIKGVIPESLRFDRLFVVNGNDYSVSRTCDPIVRSGQKVSTVFRGLPSLPEKVDVVLQFRSRSKVYFIRAKNVKVLSVY